MARFICYTLFLILINLSFSGQAQLADSLTAKADSSIVTWFLEKDFAFTPPKDQIIDTTLTYFQKYEPASSPGNLFATLGNIGLASHNLFFSPTLTLEVQPIVPAFDLYRFQHDHVHYYTSLKPYSELYYVMGKYKEQLFGANTSQTIGKNLVIGLDFTFINAFGGYPRQKSEDKSVVLKVNYFTKNMRYGLLANLMHNGFKVQENGGIQYDSVFEEKIETDPTRINVKLNTAQNTWKENSFRFAHYYSLTKPADTLGESHRTRKVFQPGSISHHAQIIKKTVGYTDDKIDTLFYPAVYFDSTKTKDALQINTIENTLAWSNSRDISTPLILTLAVRHQYDKIHYFASDETLDTTNLNHLFYSARLIMRPFKGLELKGEAELAHGDYQKGDTRITGWISKTFSPGEKEYLLSGTISFIRSTPSWYKSHFLSNYFLWNHSFDKEALLHIGFTGSLPYLDFIGNYYHYSGYVYFNFNATPEQAEKDMDVFQLKAHSPWHFKRVSLDAWGTFQFVTRTEYLRLPSLTADLSAYYNQELFKGALSTQLGLDLHYQTGYYANAYMPSSRVFYLQDEKKLNSLLVLDIVWKFKVKTARFFLVYHHLNSLFGKHDYYLVPHYPLQDGRIKFGIAWRFQD
ncbi:MAG: hypothetical protein PHD25_09060 [Bacteroidales bacterium]|nr:hypothetical protein [Bacteroidales bacterium]